MQRCPAYPHRTHSHTHTHSHSLSLTASLISCTPPGGACVPTGDPALTGRRPRSPQWHRGHSVLHACGFGHAYSDMCPSLPLLADQFPCLEPPRPPPRPPPAPPPPGSQDLGAALQFGLFPDLTGWNRTVRVWPFRSAVSLGNTHLSSFSTPCDAVAGGFVLRWCVLAEWHPAACRDRSFCARLGLQGVLVASGLWLPRGELL